MHHYVFDLGGVLVELSGLQKMLHWSNLNEEEFWLKWLTSNSVRLFESGKLDENKFAINVISEFNIHLSEKEFLNEFESWPSRFYEGVPEFLINLRKTNSISCLSNSNPIHWDKFVNNWNLKNYFDYTFASHEIGFLKPDAEIFEYLFQSIPFQKKEIIFFDDNILNVESAKKQGIEAHLVKGFIELKNKFFV